MIHFLFVSVTFLAAATAFSPLLKPCVTRPFPLGTQCYSSLDENAAATDTTGVLALSLPKPLGLCLEEVQEGKACGVFVRDVGERGSALGYADRIKGATLASVQGESALLLDFDTVMEKIGNAPDTVDLEFLLAPVAVDAAAEDAITPSFEMGTAVTIRVLQPDKADLTISAKVGDNLRTVLLDSGFEVYQGMKQKFGNCGGAGQCTFCAVDFMESEGWLDRSEYEDQKLAKFPGARLACLNNIQGPATIQKTKR